MKPNKIYCVGCRKNFYNGNNGMDIKECWNFKTAKAIKAFRIGWWIPQDKIENFQKTVTNSCHTETGSFAFYDKLPEHLMKKKEIKKPAID